MDTHVRRLALFLATLVAFSTVLVPVWSAPAVADGGEPRDRVTGHPPRFLDTGIVGNGSQEVRLDVPWGPSSRVNPTNGVTVEYTTLIVAPRTEAVPADGVSSMVNGVSRCTATVDAREETCVELAFASSCSGLAITAYCIRGDPDALGGTHIGVAKGHTALRVVLNVQQQDVLGILEGAVTVSFDNAAWPADAPRGSANVPFVTALVSPAACDNGIDDDGDGLADYPDDLGCSGTTDTTESEVARFGCDDGLDNDGDGLADYPEDPGCQSPTDTSERDPALPCDNGLDDDGDGAIDTSDPGCTGGADASELDPAVACDDGVDKDGDGWIDYPEDPGCESRTDGSETNSAIECDDGADNDGNGLTDYPHDPNCDSATDTTEEIPPACSDGIDNDGDGATDFPDDAGCTGAGDTWEGNEFVACDDGIDNDGDGLADYPGDTGCSSHTDASENTIV